MKNRRELMRNSLAIGSAVIGVNALGTATACGYEFRSPSGLPIQESETPENDNDRKAVLSAGFTQDEADCWKSVANAAGTFFALPELHPMDKQEVATAIHVIQNKLLARPTYRKYLKEAKRLFTEKQQLKKEQKTPENK